LNGDLDIIISSHSGSIQGLLNKLTERFSDMGYLKYKLWHSSEVKPHKKANLGRSSVGKKQVFDGLEKVNFYLLVFCFHIIHQRY
jgi:hypothetical protein